MKDFAVYNSNQVIALAGTIPIDSGRGDDEFCAIAKAEDEATYKASVDGAGTMSETNNTYHTVTMTLMKTSKGNALLSGLHKAGLAQGNGRTKIIVPISVVDKGSNGNLFIAPEAWIVKFPDESYAKEANTVQWVFGCHDPERFIGGH
jgi:hypothetical protein